MAQVCSAALNVLPPGVLFIQFIITFLFSLIHYVWYLLHDKNSAAGAGRNVDVIQSRAGTANQSQLF